MFEKAGYRNLIKNSELRTPGTSLLEYFKERGKTSFCRLCFCIPDVKVNTFEVPNIEISDHLPLILDFDIQT